MTVARHYRMDAAEGKGAELLSALVELARALSSVQGFEGADLLRDIDHPDCFIFIEKWSSVEAHKLGGSLLPKDALAPVMTLLARKPDGAYMTYVTFD